MKRMEKQEATVSTFSEEMLMDECELLDEYENRLSANDSNNYERKNEKGSHELVEMASDEVTSKRMRDGEFGEYI